MDFMSVLVVFVCSWWICLLMVLPLWVERDESGQPIQTSPGAPIQPHIIKKFWLATGLAIVSTLGIYGLTQTDIISFRDISSEMAQEDFN